MRVCVCVGGWMQGLHEYAFPLQFPHLITSKSNVDQARFGKVLTFRTRQLSDSGMYLHV